MDNVLCTITVPNIDWLTEQVLRGIGVRKLILEITPEIDKILRWLSGFDIENYIALRIKEHISAHIFATLMQEKNKEKINISTTSLIQDIKNWQDVRLRWLYWSQDLVYADMTGSIENYEKKKKWAIWGHENKIFIYVPQFITEYCYNTLIWNDTVGTLKENMSTLIKRYMENMKTNEVIKIKTYDLRKWNQEKTYLFRR